MPNDIPQELYNEVFALVTAIAQPAVPNEEHIDNAMASNGLERLQALYDEHERTGASHPFLTETLADFTTDAAKAIALYNLALDQCGGFPNEPRHTKRIGLAWRLHEIGSISDARNQLTLARREAFADHDGSVMAEMDELAALLG